MNIAVLCLANVTAGRISRRLPQFLVSMAADANTFVETHGKRNQCKTIELDKAIIILTS